MGASPQKLEGCETWGFGAAFQAREHVLFLSSSLSPASLTQPKEEEVEESGGSGVGREQAGVETAAGRWSHLAFPFLDTGTVIKLSKPRTRAGPWCPHLAGCMGCRPWGGVAAFRLLAPGGQQSA